MGRKPKNHTHEVQSASRRAPAMKYQEASRLADKNSRTIMKISQLLEIVHQPGYSEADPTRVVEKYINKLKARVNRRLAKLARWSDSSAEDRHAEFRIFTRPAPASSSSRPSLYSRPSQAAASQAALVPQPSSTTFARPSLPPPLLGRALPGASAAVAFPTPPAPAAVEGEETGEKKEETVVAHITAKEETAQQESDVVAEGAKEGDKEESALQVPSAAAADAAEVPMEE